MLFAPTAAAQSILNIKGEATTSLGIYIKNLKTNKVVFETNASKALVPASITKALTSATALLLLGSDFSFSTNVTLDKYTLSKGCLKGSMIIHAVGDPTLESEFFEDNRGFCDSIASRLRARGVKEFIGEIIVEDTIPDSGQVQTWGIDDTPWAYGAGFYGLNYKDNTLTLWPATGQTRPEVPGFKVIKHQSRSVNLERGVGSKKIHVYAPRKTLRNKKWSVTTTMPQPSDCLVEELKTTFEKYGINYTAVKAANSSRSNSDLLYVHYSPRLDDILTSLMHRSDNMFAEGVLRALAPGKLRDEAIDAELKLWEDRGFDTEPINICDGSGLSRSDRFAPIFLAQILEWMSKSSMADKYVSYFPLSGRSGTMKNFCKDTRLNGRLAFKTGSMNGVQCYAGYVLDPQNSNPSHVVVIMVNSFYCSRDKLKTALEDFLLTQISE